MNIETKGGEPADYPDMDGDAVPDIGSFWKHSNGDTYQVTGYADMFSQSHQKTPPRIIYRSTSTGRVWSRVLSDWYRAMKQTAALQSKACASVAWENFPAYLIDHCEGDTITEEGLQHALARMLKDPQYAALASPAPSVGEPITVEAVATVVNKPDGLELRWLIEGGIEAMAEGETLMICGERLTDDTGSGEVYLTPPAAPAVTERPVALHVTRPECRGGRWLIRAEYGSQKDAVAAEDWLDGMAAPAAAVPDPAFNYAASLATALFKQHFAHDPDYASGKVVWGLSDTTAGILTQIDNMVSGLVQPVQASLSELQKEAAELSRILAGMGEGGYDLETLYTDDQADGDAFVKRAADLLAALARREN